MKRFTILIALFTVYGFVDLVLDFAVMITQFDSGKESLGVMLACVIFSSSALGFWSVVSKEYVSLTTKIGTLIGLGSSIEGLKIILYGAGPLHSSLPQSRENIFKKLKEQEFGIENVLAGLVQMISLHYLSGDLELLSTVSSILGVGLNATWKKYKDTNKLLHTCIMLSVAIFFICEYFLATLAISFLAASENHLYRWLIFCFVLIFFMYVIVFKFIGLESRSDLVLILSDAMTSLLTSLRLFDLQFGSSSISISLFSLPIFVILSKYAVKCAIIFLLLQDFPDYHILVYVSVGLYFISFIFTFLFWSKHIKIAYFLQETFKEKLRDYGKEGSPYVNQKSEIQLFLDSTSESYHGSMIKTIMQLRLEVNPEKYSHEERNQKVGFNNVEDLKDMIAVVESSNLYFLEHKSYFYIYEELPANAEGVVNQIKDMNPKNYQFLSIVAASFWHDRREDLEVANKWLKDARTANPWLNTTHNRLGLVYLEKGNLALEEGKFDDAREALELSRESYHKAIDNTPEQETYRRAHANLVNCLDILLQNYDTLYSSGSASAGLGKDDLESEREKHEKIRHRLYSVAEV